MNIDSLESAQDVNVLRSPRAGIRRKQIGGNRISRPTASDNAQGLESSFSNMHVGNRREVRRHVRRSKSAAGATEMGVFREGDPGTGLFDISTGSGRMSSSIHATATIHSNLQTGLVTCLNSKNTAKYRVGQPYRSGFIVGIDTRLNKIIVYCPHLPPGSLLIMRSSSASKYDRGFEVCTPHGKFMGLVHAIDDVQNLVVVNTAKERT